MNKKFTNTIFKNSIDLNKNFTDERFVDPMEITSSTIDFSYTYFLTSKGNGIFKTFKGETCFDYRTNRMVNEILCHKLGELVDCACADCDYATYVSPSGKKFDGILSYETQKNYDNIYYATDFLDLDIEDGKNGFVKKFMAQIQKKLNLTQYDKIGTLRTLYKIVVFDLLTMQCDRHMENVHIIKPDGKNFYYISPLIDNEYAFCTRHFENLANLKNISKNDIIKAFNKETFPTIEEVKDKNNRYEETVKQIVKYAKRYKNFDDDLKFILKNADINKAIDEMKESGIEIDVDYQNLVTTMFELNKQKIKEEYVKTSIEEKNLSDNGKLM